MKESFNDMQFQRSLSDQAYDLLGQMIAEEETAEMLEQIRQEEAAGSTADSDRFFAEHEKQHLRLIRRTCRREKQRSFYRSTLAKPLQAIASLIAVLVLAGGAAIAASPTLRATVIEMILTETPLWLDVTVEKRDIVPDEWEGDYFMSYIPEGLKTDTVYNLAPCHSIEYRRCSDDTIALDFVEYPSDGAASYDSEHAQISYLTINGRKAVLIEKEPFLTIFWCIDDETLITVSTNDMSKEETIRIARGVQRIEK